MRRAFCAIKLHAYDVFRFEDKLSLNVVIVRWIIATQDKIIMNNTFKYGYDLLIINTSQYSILNMMVRLQRYILE